MQSATKRKGTEFVPEPNSLHTEEIGHVSAAITPYQIKQIARICDCSPETVKAWRYRRQMPQYRHLRRLKHIDAIRRMVARDFGLCEPRSLVSDLQQLANDSTHEAAEARAVLRSLAR
jgi:hypothetical protein